MKEKLGGALIAFGFIWMIGTAGGIELDTLTISQTIIYLQLSVIALLVGGILRGWFTENGND